MVPTTEYIEFVENYKRKIYKKSHNIYSNITPKIFFTLQQ